jgi:hypothetical protein
MCDVLEHGLVVPATIADHVVPHQVLSNCFGLVNYNRVAFHIMMAPSNSKSEEVLVLTLALMDFQLMMRIHSIN